MILMQTVTAFAGICDLCGWGTGPCLHQDIAEQLLREHQCDAVARLE